MIFSPSWGGKGGGDFWNLVILYVSAWPGSVLMGTASSGSKYEEVAQLLILLTLSCFLPQLDEWYVAQITIHIFVYISLSVDESIRWW